MIIGGKHTFPGWNEGIRMVFTFLLVVLSWIVFRADSVDQALGIYTRIFSTGIFSIPSIFAIRHLVLPLLTLLSLEWFRRRRGHPMQMKNETALQRRLLDALVIMMIFVYGDFTDQEFIYFQF